MVAKQHSNNSIGERCENAKKCIRRHWHSSYSLLSKVEQDKIDKDVSAEIYKQFKLLGFGWNEEEQCFTHSKPGIMEDIGNYIDRKNDEILNSVLHSLGFLFSSEGEYTLDSRTYANVVLKLDTISAIFMAHETTRLRQDISQSQAALSIVGKRLQASLPDGFTLTTEQTHGASHLILFHVDHPEFWTEIAPKDEGRFPIKLREFDGQIAQYEAWQKRHVPILADRNGHSTCYLTAGITQLTIHCDQEDANRVLSKLGQIERAANKQRKPILVSHRPLKDTLLKKVDASALGVMIVTLLNDHDISHEQLMAKINELSEEGATQKPLSERSLRKILTGETCPTQDTIYAILDAMVWQSESLCNEEKKILTERLLKAWGDRVATGVLVATPADKSLPRLSERYDGLSDMLHELMANSASLDSQEDFLQSSSYKPSAIPVKTFVEKVKGSDILKPYHSPPIHAVIEKPAVNSSKGFVVRCVEAVEQIANKENDSFSHRERMAFLNAMIDSNEDYNHVR